METERNSSEGTTTFSIAGEVQNLVAVLLLQLVNAMALPLVSSLVQLKFLPFYSQVGYVAGLSVCAASACRAWR
jgi:hypothetical protein